MDPQGWSSQRVLSHTYVPPTWPRRWAPKIIFLSKLISDKSGGRKSGVSRRLRELMADCSLSFKYRRYANYLHCFNQPIRTSQIIFRAKSPKLGSYLCLTNKSIATERSPSGLRTKTKQWCTFTDDESYCINRSLVRQFAIRLQPWSPHWG